MVRKPGRSMGRESRLHAAGDFQRVRASGRSWSHPLVVLVAAPGGSPEGWTRIGITASRRVGGAVDRNRARRRISEAIRLRYDRIESGWDLVFIVRRPATGAAFGALAGAVETLLARAGLLVEELPCAGLPLA